MFAPSSVVGRLESICGNFASERRTPDRFKLKSRVRERIAQEAIRVRSLRFPSASVAAGRTYADSCGVFSFASNRFASGGTATDRGGTGSIRAIPLSLAEGPARAHADRGTRA